MSLQTFYPLLIHIVGSDIAENEVCCNMAESFKGQGKSSLIEIVGVVREEAFGRL